MAARSFERPLSNSSSKTSSATPASATVSVSATIAGAGAGSDITGGGAGTSASDADGAAKGASDGLCCTNRVRDSSCESSVVAGMHEQTYTPNLQDQELASL
jgi:hypothetical protein